MTETFHVTEHVTLSSLNLIWSDKHSNEFRILTPFGGSVMYLVLLFLVCNIFGRGSGSMLSTFNPNNLNIKLRASGCAVRESIHLLKDNFIHRHRYSTSMWNAFEEAGLRHNDTRQGMAEVIGNLNEPYTRYLPQTSMLTRSNQIRGLAVGTGLVVKRMWDMHGLNSLAKKACRVNFRQSGWPKLAGYCAVVAPSMLWACRTQGVALPIVASSWAAVSTAGAAWFAYPHLFPLRVSKLHPELRLGDGVRIGDRFVAVDGVGVAHSSAHRIQRMLDGGKAGDTVSIVIRRPPSLSHTSTQAINDNSVPLIRRTGTLQRLSAWLKSVKNDIRSKLPDAGFMHNTQPALPSIELLRRLPCGTAELRVNLTRGLLLADSTVEASVLSPERCRSTGVGLLKIREFTDGTFSHVCQALESLQAETARVQNCSLQALVIDLRGNQGGPVAPALDLAALYLPKGTVLTQFCTGQRTERHVSTNKHADRDTSLLLLTDARTASSSEILIEALCDNGRAASLGTRTVGKNVAQAVMTLSDGSGLVFSVREFRSPTGRFMGDGHLPSMLLPSHKAVRIGNIKYDPLTKTFSYQH